MNTPLLSSRPMAATATATVPAQSPAMAGAEAQQEADLRTALPLFSAGPRAGAPVADGPEPPPAAFASSALAMPFAELVQAADAAAVRPLAASGGPEPALTGNGFTYRHNWGARRGQWTLRLNIGNTTPRSRVLVAIGEGAAGGPDNGKFIGAAKFTVHNVAPRAGGVDIWVNVEWGADIPLYVDYLIINP